MAAVLGEKRVEEVAASGRVGVEEAEEEALLDSSLRMRWKRERRTVPTTPRPSTSLQLHGAYPKSVLVFPLPSWPIAMMFALKPSQSHSTGALPTAAAASASETLEPNTRLAWNRLETRERACKRKKKFGKCVTLSIKTTTMTSQWHFIVRKLNRVENSQRSSKSYLTPHTSSSTATVVSFSALIGDWQLFELSPSYRGDKRTASSSFPTRASPPPRACLCRRNSAGPSQQSIRSCLLTSSSRAYPRRSAGIG